MEISLRRCIVTRVEVRLQLRKIVGELCVEWGDDYKTYCNYSDPYSPHDTVDMVYLYMFIYGVFIDMVNLF